MSIPHISTLSLFRQGLDTVDIASRLARPEYVVERDLHSEMAVERVDRILMFEGSVVGPYSVWPRTGQERVRP